MQPSEDKQIGGIKLRDRSFALVVFGVALLLPPIAGLSLIEAKVFGLPFPVIYAFSVWALLIIGAALLARPLRQSDTSKTASDSESRF